MRAALVCLLAWGLALQAEGFSSRSELLLYRGDFALEQDSPWNPQNRLVQQPEHTWFGEWRPDATWRDEVVTVSVKPRFLATDSSAGYRPESWINEGWVRVQPRDGLSLQAGREALLWGPSMFWNPSNPFFADNGKDNPKREISGKSFLRGRWQVGGSWALEGLVQLDNGHEEEGLRQRQALKLDWTGGETHASLVLSRAPHIGADYRGLVQWTASDAALLYGEAAWVNRDALLLASPAPSPTGWQLTPSDPGRALNLVFGGAWTFPNGTTLNAEYYHHGCGYSRAEARQLYGMAQALASQWDSPQAAMALGQLGSLFKPGTAPLGRRLLGLQLREGSGKAHEWTLRYARNLTDQSGELVAQLRWDLGDKVQVWGNLMGHHGGEGSEYGRWLRGSAMFGVSWFMW